jgi:hypothetical protein
MNPPLGVFSAVMAGLLFGVTMAAAEPVKNASEAELAENDQNPLTRYYVMRFEDNTQFGFGPDGEPQNFFRFQPLFPIQLGGNWRLLARPIVPIVHTPWPESADGLGDIAAVALLTPARSGKFAWGFGAGVLLPTATDDRLGTEKWGAGPALAGVYISGPWVIGAVVQNLWSFAGSDQRRDINVMGLRPLINYNLPNGWYLTSSPSISANWQANERNRWLVPVGGGIGKILKIGKQRVSVTVESYYHAQSPEIGPDWQTRVQFSLLYPE